MKLIYVLPLVFLVLLALALWWWFGSRDEGDESTWDDDAAGDTPATWTAPEGAAGLRAAGTLGATRAAGAASAAGAAAMPGMPSAPDSLAGAGESAARTGAYAGPLPTSEELEREFDEVDHPVGALADEGLGGFDGGSIPAVEAVVEEVAVPEAEWSAPVAEAAVAEAVVEEVAAPEVQWSAPAAEAVVEEVAAPEAAWSAPAAESVTEAGGVAPAGAAAIATGAVAAFGSQDDHDDEAHALALGEGFGDDVSAIVDELPAPTTTPLSGASTATEWARWSEESASEPGSPTESAAAGVAETSSPDESAPVDVEASATDATGETEADGTDVWADGPVEDVEPAAVAPSVEDGVSGDLEVVAEEAPAASEGASQGIAEESSSAEPLATDESAHAVELVDATPVEEEQSVDATPVEEEQPAAEATFGGTPAWTAPAASAAESTTEGELTAYEVGGGEDSAAAPSDDLTTDEAPLAEPEGWSTDEGGDAVEVTPETADATAEIAEGGPEVEPAEGEQPADDVEVAQSVEPAEPAGPAEAVELAESAESVEAPEAGGDWQYDEAHAGLQASEDAAPMPSQAPETEAWGRRISDLEEVVDGGFGMGSAAPIADGAQPIGHAIQAYFDTRTYRTQDAPGYDSCEPDVWFFDEAAAQRAGFGPAQEG